MTNRWDIDVAHSAIQFHVRHMLISKVHGRFAKWTGAIALDAQDLTRSQVEVSIDAASIDTQVADRDAHLRSGDFLDVANHPQLTFRSKRIEQAGQGYRVTGDLTLRGVTKEVVLDAEFAGVGKDPWGNERAGFSAKASLDRREFGLVWNAALEAGGVLVGEKVEITIELEAVKKVAAAPVAA
jgi:polyisoprenoid-binding protein YceI